MIIPLEAGALPFGDLGSLLGTTVPPAIRSVIPSRLVTDAREIQKGDLFCALKDKRDGHAYITDAVARGAVATIAERRVEGQGKYLLVPSVRAALAKWAAAVTRGNRPVRIGITGSERLLLRGRRKGYTRRFLIPDDTRFGEEIELSGDTSVADGEKVEVQLIRHKSRPVTGEVLRSFGRAGTKTANYAAILAANGIPDRFTDDVLSDAARAASMPLADKDRRRVTETVFTIDGAGAKDLDDAISLSRLENGGYRLGVHIADVSYYVTAGSPTDLEAMARGTSVYFADKVVPMLPESLSNGACSLNAGEDKYAMSAYMTLDKSGEILETTVERTVIRSAVRGVYEEVNDLFRKKTRSRFYEKYGAVYGTLTEMRELYRILAKKAKARGAIDFDRPEGVILLDESGDVTDVVERTRGDGEKMIEQFMLTANTGVARLLHEKKIPCVYRLHETPDPERVQDFIGFADALGLETGKIRATEGREPAAFAALLREAANKGIASGVSYVLLRTMAKARYSADKWGHFGLSIPLYCHFTSPIRRYSDLATHRMIGDILLSGGDPVRCRAFAHRAADAATDGEARALSAERAIDDMYKTIYMAKHIGEEYEAEISGLAPFGIFATLDNTCEGLIRFSETDRRYTYDERRQIVVGENGVFRLGDRIRVRVEDADMLNCKVKFTFLAKIEKEQE